MRYLYYVALNKLRKKSDSLLNDVNIRFPDSIQQMKKSVFFNGIYFICEKTQETALIDVNKIQNKCVIYEMSNQKIR